MERYGHGANLSSEQQAHLAVLGLDKLNGPLIFPAAFERLLERDLFLHRHITLRQTLTTSKKNSSKYLFCE